jgi:hypothetical protein
MVDPQPPSTPSSSLPSAAVPGTPPWELVRQFAEELAGSATIDWKKVEKLVGGSTSLEEAIGEAVVVADHMSRGLLATDEGPIKVAFRTAVSYLRRAALPRVQPADGRRFGFSIVLAMLLLALAGTAGYFLNVKPSTAVAYHAPSSDLIAGNASFESSSVALSSLPAATAPPAPAPPTLADAAPLQPHEVFGFVPYWSLPDSTGINVSGISTLAYFGIGVNPDGSLDETGSGWNGYESQALSDLITRAHGAGDRVVLTVTCFDQTDLNQLTSSPSAPSMLATALISAIQAKNLDGVNLDFEGQGSADQSGLTNLVAQVSDEIHAVNPHYQVTMDTYASSAGDPNGFYNIRALSPAVDAFFVMAYQLNLESTTSTTSPLTSSMFSDQTTIDQYAAAVPPSKVLLGMPFFGIDWPTTNGTLTAQATGPSSPISYAQVISSGHPIYWDATTDTAWTSYQVGTQWHETFFEDPTSLYDAAELAGASDLGGVGIWALGMEGDAPTMLTALQGFAPALKDGPVGPTTTTTSTSTSTTTSSTTTTSTTSTTTTTTTPPTSTTSTTTTVPSASGSPTLSYSGTWNDSSVDLTLVEGDQVPAQSGDPVGQLSAFATDDTTMSCLSSGPDLDVYAVSGSSDEYLVVASTDATPPDCTDADFTFDTSQ